MDQSFLLKSHVEKLEKFKGFRFQEMVTKDAILLDDTYGVKRAYRSSTDTIGWRGRKPPEPDSVDHVSTIR